MACWTINLSIDNESETIQVNLPYRSHMKVFDHISRMIDGDSLTTIGGDTIISNGWKRIESDWSHNNKRTIDVTIETIDSIH